MTNMVPLHNSPALTLTCMNNSGSRLAATLGLDPSMMHFLVSKISPVARKVEEVSGMISSVEEAEASKIHVETTLRPQCPYPSWRHVKVLLAT